LTANHEVISTQVLVIGSEGAGARAAIEASDRGAQVALVTKGRLARSGATVTAAADMDVDGRSIGEILGWGGSEDDSPEAYLKDMVVEGKYLNDQPLAQVLATEAPARLREMLAWGLRVYDVRQMPGHSRPRNVYTSGGDVARTLRKQVRRRPVQLLEEVMITGLLLSGGRVCGAAGLDIRRGVPLVIRAGAVVLATGGAHHIFPFTTGPEGQTGDGHAMAIRVGAEMINLEMVQSLPTILLSPPMMRGSIFIFLLGPQSGVRGWLLNRYGERFMERWDLARMERSTRDVLSVAIASEVAAGRGSPSGGVYFSTAHLPRNLVWDFARWGAKPYIRTDWTAHGLDYRPVVERLMAGEGVEVAPAVHFFMGGVRIDERCQTTLPYLLAAGEVAGGVHGANRLSGNAFTQMLVQGRVAGERAAELAMAGPPPDPDPALLREALNRLLQPLERRGDGVTGYEAMEAIQAIAGDHAGVVRDEASLSEGIDRLRRLKTDVSEHLHCTAAEREYNPGWVEALQARSAIPVLEGILRSALLRGESRGAHFRSDFPDSSAEWLRNVLLRSEDDGDTYQLRTEPVRAGIVPLPAPAHDAGGAS
jgi:succinate dehydrogenase/fumarate reductase flavoprotein subunit